TLVRAFILASAFTSARVVSTRLDRSNAFLCAVHRPPAIEAPARFTTASAPTPSPREPTKGAPPNSPVAGFQATANPSFAPSPPAVCGRTSRQPLCPARASARTSAVPTSPDEPVAICHHVPRSVNLHDANSLTNHSRNRSLFWPPQITPPPWPKLHRLRKRHHDRATLRSLCRAPSLADKIPLLGWRFPQPGICR